jgi:hypothetical protein
MQRAIKEIQDAVQEVRDAVKSVSAKAKERISSIESRLDICQACPTQDRRTADRRKLNADWLTDSDFKVPNEKQNVS